MSNDVVIHIKATDKASGPIAAVTGKAQGLGGVLGGPMAMGAKVGTAALVGVGVASINLAANFQSTMSSVGAVSQATAEEMKGLSKEALNIGKDTAFSANEAAQAMEILAANGVSARDIMGGAARAAVDLAAAGGTNLKLAADAASTSMAVWNLKTADMTEVVNRLAGAANVSRFGVEDMAQAVAMGGGAAASAGVEFGDFATTIAAIAPSFSSGSDAGTSFKQFLNGLTPTSDKAASALRELGIITEENGNRFFDAKGSLKSMADITDILNVATKNLTEQQKAEALETIFGSDAMRAAAAISKLTGEEFQKMSDTMKNTDAQEVAKARMDNFKGSMEALKGSIETIMIEIGLKLLPVLQKYADWLANVGIPAVEAWYLKNKKTIEDIYEVVSKTLEILIELMAGRIRTILSAWEMGFDMWQGLFKVFKGLFTGDWEMFFEGLKQIVLAPLEFIKRQFEIVYETINAVTDGALGELAGTFETVFSAVKNTVMLAAADVLEAIRGLFQHAKDVADAFPGPNPLGGAMQTAIDGMTDAIEWSRGTVRAQMEGVGRDAVTGLVNGMRSEQAFAENVAAQIAYGIEAEMRAALQSQSPSRVMMEIGEDIIDGLAIGMEDSRPKLLSAIYDINKTLLTVADGAVREQLKQQLAALLADLDAATVAAAGLPPAGSAAPRPSLTPDGTSTPGPRQGAAQILRGALSSFPGVPSAGFFEGALGGKGSIAPLIAWFNSAAGQALQNAPRLLTAIGRAGTAANTDLLTLLRNNGLSFDRGGIVPGPIGAPQLALVHGGEEITPAGGGGVVINNYVQAWDSRDVERWFENNADRMASAVERSRGRRMR